MQQAVRRSTASGFTLLEIVICLMLITLSAMLALDGFRAIQGVRPFHEIIALRQFIELARSTAIRYGIDEIITIDSKRMILSNTTNQRAEALHCVWGAPAGAFGPPANPVNPIVKPCTFSGNQILCTASGALSAGTLYCAIPSKNEWYALTASVGDLGPIRLYRYHEGRWVLW